MFRGVFLFLFFVCFILFYFLFFLKESVRVCYSLLTLRYGFTPLFSSFFCCLFAFSRYPPIYLEASRFEEKIGNVDRGLEIVIQGLASNERYECKIILFFLLLLLSLSTIDTVSNLTWRWTLHHNVDSFFFLSSFFLLLLIIMTHTQDTVRCGF